MSRPSHRHQGSDPASPPSPGLSLSRVRGRVNVSSTHALCVFSPRSRPAASRGSTHSRDFAASPLGERLPPSHPPRSPGPLAATALLFHVLVAFAPAASCHPSVLGPPPRFVSIEALGDTPFHCRSLSWKKTARFVVEFLLLLNY